MEMYSQLTDTRVGTRKLDRLWKTTEETTDAQMFIENVSLLYRHSFRRRTLTGLLRPLHMHLSRVLAMTRHTKPMAVMRNRIGTT